MTADWRRQLRRVADECAERWSLRLGEPFPYAYASVALAAELPDGREAVLKISRPHRESEHEADALARWRGVGSVRLLAHDRERSALLLERCRPGTPLSEIEAEAALEVIAGLLPGLSVPAAARFRPLAEEAEWWSSYLPEKWECAGQPFERALLEAGLEALRELARTQGEQVLLHQDLHADNILRAERERARGWALAQTRAWAWEGDEVLPRHVETARWLARA